MRRLVSYFFDIDILYDNNFVKAENEKLYKYITFRFLPNIIDLATISGIWEVSVIVIVPMVVVLLDG